MDPTAHFTKEQIDVLKDIHHAETNKLLVKIISVNLITIIFAVGAVATGWYRLGLVESQTAQVLHALDTAYVTKEHSEQQHTNLQQQITSQKEVSTEIKMSVNRIEDKLDRYIFGK
jgi:hypothetical protein